MIIGRVENRRDISKVGWPSVAQVFFKGSAEYDEFYPQALFMMHFRFTLRRLLGVLFLFGVGGGLLACGSGQDGGSEVEVIEPRLVQTPDGKRAFTGTLVNQGAQRLSIVQVEVALYDENGSPVETVRIEVKDIPAQDSVDFSGTIDSDQSFRQAQVKSVLTP